MTYMLATKQSLSAMNISRESLNEALIEVGAHPPLFIDADHFLISAEHIGTFTLLRGIHDSFDGSIINISN